MVVLVIRYLHGPYVPGCYNWQLREWFFLCASVVNQELTFYQSNMNQEGEWICFSSGFVMDELTTANQVKTVHLSLSYFLPFFLSTFRAFWPISSTCPPCLVMASWDSCQPYPMMVLTGWETCIGCWSKQMHGWGKEEARDECEAEVKRLKQSVCCGEFHCSITQPLFNQN